MKMKMMVLTVILLYVSQHALGVEVFEGVESVLLPCQVTDSVSKDSAVLWSREDLRDPIVHLRLQSREDLRNQNQLYRNRTWMRTDSLQTGDLSLTLRKPTIRDSSTYTCSVRKFGLDQSRTEVQLTVREPPPVWPQVLAAVLVPLVLLVLSAGVFIVYKMWKDRQVQQVEVEDGVESVQLSCKIKDRSGVRTVRLSGDVRVEWMDSDNRKVHVYQNGSDRPEDQDQVYRDRTEMKEDLLRTGDLSLTLKHLTVRDRGRYTCKVYKDGNFLRGKTVILWVNVQKVEEGVESVQLPFKTTPHLSGDVRVEWTDSYDRKVHVYQNSSDRPEEQSYVYRDRTEMKEDLLRTGDLSLTLKHLTVRDTGYYTCRVYKDRNLLRGKTVTLKVKGKQVEVEEGAESVQLPFKTTADLSGDVRVEWMDRDRKVHVYQNGSDRPEDQDQVYRDRTEMKEDLLRTGDLSLTLKHLTVRDTGDYTCSVYKDGNLLRGKTVTLWVKGQQVEVEEEEEESVQLPLKTTADLSGHVRVEWTDRDNRKVHVYQNGSDRPEDQDQVYRDRTEMKEDLLRTGDLSLTLKHLTVRDTGGYTCRVYKDGNFLRGKTVTLWVKERCQDTKNSSFSPESTPLTADQSV